MDNFSILVKSGVNLPSVPAFILAGILSLFVSCEPDTRPARSTAHIMMMDDTVVNYNRQVVKAEDEEMNDFIARHQWKMSGTLTGLRYMIYEKGKGVKVNKGDKVILKYVMSLLNGQKVYSSDSLGLKIIFPGTSEGETGLQEALQLMREGDHAKLLVPSHLAYGLLGDMKRIPARATLVYDVEIVSVGKANR
jgi:FKBP-type peptidyl-prolyl cis-trans isomerase